MRNVLICTLLLVWLSSTAAWAEERPLKVFVLAGTSNMIGGNAPVDKLPEDLREPLKDVLVFRNGDWSPLEAGKNLTGNEATFGQAMAKHLGEPVGIIWMAVRYVADAPLGAGVNNIVKHSREKGRSIQIAGLLLDVSFGDGLKEETAKVYGEKLTVWLEGTRKNLGDPELPVVMNRAIPPRLNTPHLETVRQAQESLKLPNFVVFSCDDVPRGGDKVHFNTEGRLEMGKRFAAAMIELTKGVKK
jgi:hypothetical protein